jgi:hypothetical protein
MAAPHWRFVVLMGAPRQCTADIGEGYPGDSANGSPSRVHGA